MAKERTVEDIRAELAGTRANLKSSIAGFRESVEPKNVAKQSVADVKQFAQNEFNEAKKHGFWMRNVDRMYLRFIDGFTATKNRGIYLGDYSADDILDMFVYHDDGSPCGVKIG